jgi:hypothetical protein
MIPEDYKKQDSGGKVTPKRRKARKRMRKAMKAMVGRKTTIRVGGGGRGGGGKGP